MLKMKRLVIIFLSFCPILLNAKNPVLPPDSLKQAQVDSLLSLGVGRLSVSAPSKDQIRAFVKSHPILDNGTPPEKYSVQPRTKNQPMPGQLTAEFVARGLNAINVLRFIAGLDADVQLADSEQVDCQQAALMCAVTKIDRQSAKNPSGMSREQFKKSLETYNQSVLAVGGSSLDRSILFNLSKSSGKDVTADVCSRRHLLNPMLEKVALGHVGKYALVKPMVKTGEMPVNQGIVAWPAQNTPLDYFDISTPLSLSFSDDYDIKGNVILVMVRQNDGKVWKFGRLLPNFDGFYSTSSKDCGTSNCIVWKPDLDQYRANDFFSIHVAGVKYKGVELPTIEYTISFFNLFTVFVNGYLNIMEPVSSINSADYKGNQEITSVDMPATVKSIGNQAFAGCINLERVTLPQSLPAVPNEMFKGCVRLKSISLPHTVKTIGVDAFAGCSAMGRFGISYKLQTIESGAFMGCAALREIDLPETLHEIGTKAFANCVGLTKVEIPLHVTKIGVSAFSGCKALKTVTFAEAPTATLELQPNVFQGCTSIDSISIPGSVRAISQHAFAGCSSLKVIHIAEGVKRIDEKAFDKTPLQRIYIPASVERIGHVSSIPSTAIIICKPGSYAEKWAKGLYRKYQLAE